MEDAAVTLMEARAAGQLQTRRTLLTTAFSEGKMSSPDLEQGLCPGNTDSHWARGFTTNPKPH